MAHLTAAYGLQAWTAFPPGNPSPRSLRSSRQVDDQPDNASAKQPIYDCILSV